MIGRTARDDTGRHGKEHCESWPTFEKGKPFERSSGHLTIPSLRVFTLPTASNRTKYSPCGKCAVLYRTLYLPASFSSLRTVATRAPSMLMISTRAIEFCGMYRSNVTSPPGTG